MQYYLAKTEPTTYSITDLERDGTTTWDGVTNFLAVKYLKAMRPGDYVLIYHSGKDKAVVGLAEVTGESRHDPKESKSWLVDFRFVRRFDNPVTLKEIKDSGLFDDEKLVRQGRLSTMEVSDKLLAWLRAQGLDI